MNEGSPEASSLGDSLIACLDVHYAGDEATVAAVMFSDWADAKPAHVRSITVPTPSEYVPGEFYKRELPCLLALLEKLLSAPSLIIIDGYVWLADNAPGLGGHLYHALNQKVPVVGIAKTCFKNHTGAQAVRRATSERPLFVTAAGMDAEEAARHVALMAGDYRMPTLLKLADQVSRGKAAS